MYASRASQGAKVARSQLRSFVDSAGIALRRKCRRCLGTRFFTQSLGSPGILDNRLGHFETYDKIRKPSFCSTQFTPRPIDSLTDEAPLVFPRSEQSAYNGGTGSVVPIVETEGKK